MQTFKDQEAEYLQWLTENPSSYVANLDKRQSFRDYRAAERLDVGMVGREVLDDPRGEQPLAAVVAENRAAGSHD